MEWRRWRLLHRDALPLVILQGAVTAAEDATAAEVAAAKDAAEKDAAAKDVAKDAAANDAAAKDAAKDAAANDAAANDAAANDAAAKDAANPDHTSLRNAQAYRTSARPRRIATRDTDTPSSQRSMTAEHSNTLPALIFRTSLRLDHVHTKYLNLF